MDWSKHFANLTLSFFLFIFFAFNAAAVIRPTVARNSHPDPFSEKGATKWGGVILQNQAKFFDAENGSIDATELKLEYDEKSQTLCFVNKGTCFAHEIPDDDLGRIIAWIDQDGAGLFTAYELEKSDMAAYGMSELQEGFRENTSRLSFVVHP